MYEDIETETSYKYLKTVVSRLKEPICILGGWAVFFTVSKSFKEAKGRVYLGSRDIDLGFASANSLNEAGRILENELHFDFVSFRYFKNIHAETGEELDKEKAKAMPQHMMFPIYVDPIISKIDKDTKQKLGFVPIDEPLLQPVFNEKKHRIEIREFGRKLLLPSPAILLATKLNAIVDRDEKHKRIKDLCDIVALCLFSGAPMNNIIKTAKQFVPGDKLTALRRIAGKEEIAVCSSNLGIGEGIIREMLPRIG